MTMIRTAGGALAPMDEAGQDAVRKIKVGAVVRVDLTRMRNGAFHRKWFALLRLGFDLWSEHATMPTYRGQPVAPEFDRFRRDVTILAGFRKVVVNVRGEARVEAESVRWSEMSEERFEALYDKTIDVLLRRVLPDGVTTEARLREAVDLILGFT